jgi:hypothetical protein
LRHGGYQGEGHAASFLSRVSPTLPEARQKIKPARKLIRALRPGLRD